MWLSYLQLEAHASDLDYDLAVSADRGGEPSIDDAGVGPASVVPVVLPDPGPALWPVALGLGAGIVVMVGLAGARRNSTVTRRLSP